MLTRRAHWAMPAIIGFCAVAAGCSRSPADDAGPVRTLRIPLSDDSLIHALDTSVEMRAVDRFELDSFLSERDSHIDVMDGVVVIAGSVWTPLEKERVGNLVRSVAGMVDVSNELAIRPPL